MPERVWCWPDRDDPARVDFWASADARAEEDKNAVPYLRADLALPRPWRTAADLDALPVGSVVLDQAGHPYERLHYSPSPHYGWWAGTDGLREATDEISERGPGLILYVPEAR